MSPIKYCEILLKIVFIQNQMFLVLKNHFLE